MAIAAAEEGTKTRRDTGRRVPANDSPSRPRKALTIGAVAKILGQEFDDISISKIRYLEDQKLLAPRRTAGGYRLYSQADVERLRAILRMQRDEFLPLRVIRQELATGDFAGARRGSDAAATRRAASVDASVSTMTLEELLDEAGVSESLFLRELQEFGIVAAGPSRRADGLRRDRPRDRARGGGALALRRRRAGISASSGPPPTARRRCSSRSWVRRFAREARRGARRRSRTSKASRRSAGTSSICCWSATSAASRAIKCSPPEIRSRLATVPPTGEH